MTMQRLSNPTRHAAKPTRNPGKVARGIRLTPEGRATLQAYRPLDKWRRVYTMLGDVRYVRIQRAPESEVNP